MQLGLYFITGNFFMIYVSITPRSWLFSHMENNFGLPQVLIKTALLASHLRTKRTLPVRVLYILSVIKWHSLPLPDEGSSELLKHTIQKIYPECTAGLSYTNTHVRVGSRFHPKLTQLIWGSEISEETETHFIAGRWRAGITIIWCITVVGLKQHILSAEFDKQRNTHRTDTQQKGAVTTWQNSLQFY